MTIKKRRVKSPLFGGFTPAPKGEHKSSSEFNWQEKTNHNISWYEAITNKKTRPLVRGFTVIELIVAITVFAVIMDIALGGFANALRTQRQATGFILANTNIAFALEQMAREMRTGRDFVISLTGIPCLSSTGLNVTFANAINHLITYCYDATSGSIGREDTNPGAAKAITSDKVNVRYFDAILSEKPGYPTQVTLLVGVSPREATVSDYVINIQTTVSARFTEN